MHPSERTDESPVVVTPLSDFVSRASGIQDSVVDLPGRRHDQSGRDNPIQRLLHEPKRRLVPINADEKKNQPPSHFCRLRPRQEKKKKEERTHPEYKSSPRSA